MLVIRRISIISFLRRLAILRKVIRIPVHYWPQFWLCHCFILYEYIIYYVNSIRELRYSLGTRDHMLRSKLYTKEQPGILDCKGAQGLRCVNCCDGYLQRVSLVKCSSRSNNNKTGNNYCKDSPAIHIQLLVDILGSLNTFVSYRRLDKKLHIGTDSSPYKSNGCE